MRLFGRQILNLNKHWTRRRSSFGWYYDALKTDTHCVLLSDFDIFYSDDNCETGELIRLPNTSSADRILRQVAYGNNIWVCSSSNSYIYYSSDLENWSYVYPGGYSSTYDWRGVVYADGYFYTIGKQSNTSKFLKSSDGQSWSNIDIYSIPSNLCKLDCDNTNLVSCVGDSNTVVKISTNGNYTSATVGTTGLKRLRFLNNKYIAVGTNGISISTDFENWEDIKIVDNFNCWDISYGKGIYTVVGEDGKYAISPDLYDWNVEQHPSEYQLFSTSADDDLIIIGGNSGLTIYR